MYRHITDILHISQLSKFCVTLQAKYLSTMKNKATYIRKNQPYTQKDILSSFKLSHLERTNNKTNSLEDENSQLIDSFELIINNQQGLRNKCLDNNNLLLTDVEGNQNHSYLLEKQIKTLKQKIDELQSKKNVVY